MRTVYVPFAQVSELLAHEPVFLAVGPRTADVAAAVRSVVSDVDARFGAPDVRPLDDVVTASLATERFNASLIVAFARIDPVRALASD